MRNKRNPYALINPNDYVDNSSMYRGNGMAIDKVNQTVSILLQGASSPTTFIYTKDAEASMESLVTAGTLFIFRSMPNSFKGNVIQWFSTTETGNEFKMTPKYGY